MPPRKFILLDDPGILRYNKTVMIGQNIGHLPQSDPLHGYLQYDIQPQMTGWRERVKYRVYRLNGSNDVYLYEDKYTGARFVGKFFLSGAKRDYDTAVKRLTREYDNLCMMRDRGMCGYPHYVARPLGRNYSLNCLLVTEYCEGELLSDAIQYTIATGDQGRLFHKLTALAYFLASFHNRTAAGAPVNFDEECAYVERLVGRLLEINAIGWGEADEIRWLRDRWREQPKMWQDTQVLVHGDATPDNFMYGGGIGVIAFDMERAHRADRVLDAGRIAGELKHFFLRATGDRYAAEPYIGHFLWEYSWHFPDNRAAFAAVTSRAPFYMAATLLRISRNSWISHEHRRGLIDEAKSCLRSYSI